MLKIKDLTGSHRSAFTVARLGYRLATFKPCLRLNRIERSVTPTTTDGRLPTLGFCRSSGC